MERVEPSPGRQSFVIVLAIKFQAFNVLLDDFRKFEVVLYVLDIEPTLIIGIDAVDYFLVLYLELLDLGV